MRVIFAGTPEFARVALERLHAAGFEIALVLTQPDRPAGRGMKLQASSVKQWAQSHGLLVAQPRSLRLNGKYPEDAEAAKTAIEAAQADVMVVAAYGLILPQWVLDMMEGRSDGPPQAGPAPAGGSVLREAKSVGANKFGCLNIHASLLPRWRGAAPIHRAIEAGDAQTGITIMQMDAGLDTGDMLLVERLAIDPADSTESLHDKLAALGGRLIVEALELAALEGESDERGLSATPQPIEGISYAHKIEKHEASIDWTQSAAVIERRIRAFKPFPIASSTLHGEVIKFHQGQVLTPATPSSARPGQVLAVSADGVDVATGEGVLRLIQLQKSGGKAMDAANFLRGFDIAAGVTLGSEKTTKPG